MGGREREVKRGRGESREGGRVEKVTRAEVGEHSRRC